MIELTGTLVLVKDKELVGQQKKFSKRECVLKLDSGRREELIIEFHQFECDKLDGYDKGEKVAIEVLLRGRSWLNPNGPTKWFNSIQGCEIKHIKD